MRLRCCCCCQQARLEVQGQSLADRLHYVHAYAYVRLSSSIWALKSCRAGSRAIRAKWGQGPVPLDAETLAQLSVGGGCAIQLFASFTSQDACRSLQVLLSFLDSPWPTGNPLRFDTSRRVGKPTSASTLSRADKQKNLGATLSAVDPNARDCEIRARF